LKFIGLKSISHPNTLDLVSRTVIDYLKTRMYNTNLWRSAYKKYSDHKSLSRINPNISAFEIGKAIALR
jgi:hypothetical protein